VDIIKEFEVRETYDIGFIRRQITDLMTNLQFSEKKIAEVAIVVSELCSNLIKHSAVDGKIKILQILGEGRTGIEIVAEDKGPGIENVDEALKDGVSSRGTMGGGFGAIRRLSDFFDISSNKKMLGNSTIEPGTIVTVRKWSGSSLSTLGTNNSDISISVLSRPYKGLAVNGDSYYFKSFQEREIIAVIDGLGHGTQAYEAANCAVKTIDGNTHKSIEEIIRTMNKDLKKTRGAVVALFIIDKFKKEFEMLSIGNIDSRYMSENSTERLFSNNGFIGAYNGNCKTIRRAYKKGDMLVICTDGISPRWETEKYTNGFTNNPAALCNIIFKEYSRENDDATTLVAIL
jgi:anti-sigma regulatory factor (Ser/Thr protein kinase)/serine/threonine protein phosphatase PrpC